MSGNDGPLEKVRFLAGATSRVRVMEYLAGSGPADQPELRANVAGSRTTISRALRSLEDEGWVATEDNTYRLTHTGSVVADEFADLLATIRRTEELSEFLRWFPTDSDAPDFLRARDVDVTASTDANPYARRSNRPRYSTPPTSSAFCFPRWIRIRPRRSPNRSRTEGSGSRR